jgi:hypothetical protein
MGERLRESDSTSFSILQSFGCAEPKNVFRGVKTQERNSRWAVPPTDSLPRLSLTRAHIFVRFNKTNSPLICRRFLPLPPERDCMCGV